MTFATELMVTDAAGAPQTLSLPAVRPIAISGVDYKDTGIAPVTGTISAAGATAPLALMAGRPAYLWLSGGTRAVGVIEYAWVGGGSWYRPYAVDEGMTGFDCPLTPSPQFVPLYVPTQPGVLMRVRFTDVTGTVSYRLQQ